MFKNAPTTIAIAGVLLLLASTCSTVFAQAVPGAVLYFNPAETDQGRNDKVWRNAGEAGGELEHTGKLPTLEEGTIEIKEIGFKETTKWYTAEESGSTFSNGAPGNKTPVVNLQDFTLGLLVRINGGLLAEEHHLVGLQASPREQVQNVRIWLDNGGSGNFQNVSIAQGAIGAREDLGHGKTRLSVGSREWHWAHFVFESGDEITTYIDGKEVAQFGTGVKWNKKHDMSLHAIFSHSQPEARRTCNCSIAIYRVYDRALSAAEIDKNVRGSFAVEPTDKLTTTWGKVKRGF